jgi:hypothetical protein
LRGIYSGKSGSVFLEDLFGFTRFTLFNGDRVCLYIYPGIEPNGFRKEKVIRGGEKATADFSRMRSDELLETRKYYPGDDARRINWKIYAASGELFLRIGEEIPPPTGEITFLLNSYSQRIYGLSISSSLSDELIKVYLAFITAYVEKGCVVTTLVPGVKDPFIFNPEKPDELLKALSGVTAGTKLSEYRGNSFVYVLSNPASPFLKDLSVNGEGDMKIFIKSIPHDMTEKSIFRILFRKDCIHKLPLKESREIRDLNDEAQNELMLLKKLGKGKIHGEII